MAAQGWSWLELQEACLQAERRRLGQAETAALYEEELAAKDEKIAEIALERDEAREALSEMREAAAHRPEGILDAAFLERLGPEMWPGEMTDRLRAAIAYWLEHAEDEGWDSRSRAVLRQMHEKSQVSSGLRELRADLSAAVRDRNRLSQTVQRLLERHGFAAGQTGKHPKLSPRAGFAGLVPITVMSTPGDRRGQDNLRHQIENALGLKRLDD
ncbi:hypothetical protein [Phaeovulum vinaykumarii]|uniref:Uncharacterized protein n=1 Tax=Phaeovulum vinaykumarii TaxID=407234 RepID=A0A1N7L4W8_9RHOB|nr:hypothetical protein [Phaeovulum vinaykumarii]SIS68867.1 hypothetical protein SAMN05421795_102562 [Phaeovulum vinaykumarii]SOB99806.1 hypothetical protein SAMN05878426_102210 [Phaeovulum vinaykumarii]